MPEDKMTLVDQLTIFALIAGPIIAVIITLWHQNRSQRREAKERLFVTLMAHRQSNPPTLDWASALNLIDVVYANHPKVLDKWHDLYNIVIQLPVNWQRWSHVHIELLSEMAKVLGYKHLTQTQIDRFYTPQAHGDQAHLNFELQTELLRVLKGTHSIQAVPSTPKIENQSGPAPR